MDKYFLRDIRKKDYRQVAAVYNSNRRFLLNHLGTEHIDETFISDEVSNTRKAGFTPCVIVDKETLTLRGVLDYKPGQETYLSLLMLSADLQAKGVGRDVYFYFEEKMRLLGSTSIRIDVVDDYPDHAVAFWKRLGFLECQRVTLDWHGKKSRAVVMRRTVPQ